jgi:hypothetical protein
MARKIPPPPTTNSSVDSWEYRNWFNLLWRRVKNLEGGGGATEKGDEDAIHVNWANEITGITQKSSLANTDEFVIEDAEDSYSKKAVTFSNIRRLRDSYAHTYGTGDDATILYDGTDLVINPKVAGTGLVDITGTVRHDGRIENINSTAKTANYTVTATDDNVLCDTSGGAFTITLPASPETGRVYTVILETAGYILTIDGNGNNIIGSTTLTLSSADDAAQLIYNGTQWSLK